MAVTSGEGTASNSRDAASAVRMPSGVRRAQRLAQIGVVEQQQLVIGEPSPVARVVDASLIDPRDLRNGRERRRPTRRCRPRSRRSCSRQER